MRQYEVALTLLPGIGDITAKKLVAYCGGLESVFKSSRRDLLKLKALTPGMVQKVLDGREAALKRASQELAFIDRYQISTLFFLNKDYPYRLSNCADSPVMLYYKGNADLNAVRIIGIVGTRKATAYGKDFCTRLIEGFSSSDVLVVSGLALGIDSCAHKSALGMGIPTVGVLGHGLDRIYPPQNKAMAGKMLKNGGLLTDFPSETQPDRENFPKRNRIIAGLCDALVVVEAAETGGALITADIANSYDRDVFAVPGRIGDKFSQGCNKYIKTNRAALIESAEDIKYLMGWDDASGKNRQQTLFVELSDEETRIRDLIRQYSDPGIDVLVMESGYNSSSVAKILLNLEFNGVIRSLPGKRYQLA
jgi:DNA processing protein